MRLTDLPEPNAWEHKKNGGQICPILFYRTVTGLICSSLYLAFSAICLKLCFISSVTLLTSTFFKMSSKSRHLPKVVIRLGVEFSVILFKSCFPRCLHRLVSLFSTVVKSELEGEISEPDLPFLLPNAREVWTETYSPFSTKSIFFS